MPGNGAEQFLTITPSGFLKLGVIESFDKNTLTVEVKSESYQQEFLNKKTVQLPVSAFNSNGLFMGAYPEPGTLVVLGQGEGRQWYIVSILARPPAGLNFNGPEIPSLSSGELVAQVDENNKMLLSKSRGMVFGEQNNSLSLKSDKGLMINNFDNIYSSSEAGRNIDGTILRDVFPNQNYTVSLKDDSIDYNLNLKSIGLDPVHDIGWSNIGSSVKNPSRTEKREIIYEFGKSFNVLDPKQEILNYKDGKNSFEIGSLNRRVGRADTISLSQVAPNFLIETIKGTVVDANGNILDINRSVLPIGKSDKLSIKNIKTNLQENSPLGNVYDNIYTLNRRSIAYHFEINTKTSILSPPDVNDKSNYARQRSKFSLDIDKEGLLKLNVPASSEKGNIPLLTRYENYSTVSPNQQTKSPLDLSFNEEKKDVLIEGFATTGVVSIVDSLNPNAAPIDRFSSANSPQAVKHGTVYHNIAETCKTYQSKDYVYERVSTTLFNTDKIPVKNDIVSKEIKLSGKDANGGGRSASVNFDGSLELNIGANTVDRHSLWLDTQGAIVGNVGRDLRNNISAALAFDGEVLIQSGGSTPSTDKRFITVNGQPVNNGPIAGAIDLRIINSSNGKVNIFRIDDSGISVHSESRVVMYANGNILMRSMGTFEVDAENLILNGRRVRRDTGLGSI